MQVMFGNLPVNCLSGEMLVSLFSNLVSDPRTSTLTGLLELLWPWEKWDLK